VVDYQYWARTMPCDETLLAAVGRVNWAAARLHAGVRDAINHITSIPSDKPFELTLGTAVAQLERRAAKRVAEPDLTRLTTWCSTVGRPAVDRRNKVIHAVTFTAADGLQAIGTVDHSPPSRFLEPDLMEIAGILVDASRQLPPGPYAMQP
jgi:hypothetical protein